MRELFELWAMWWSGPLPVTATLLWGRPIWWWERVGTVVQVLAILGLVFELIGERRLHEFAKQIHEAPKSLKLSSETPEDETATDTIPELVFFALVFGVSVFAAFQATAFFVFDSVDAMSRFLVQYLPRTVVIVIRFIVGMGLYLIVLAIFSVVTMLALSPVFSLIFRGFARLLQSRRLRTLLNVGIVFASVFNLHFTLLAQ